MNPLDRVRLYRQMVLLSLFLLFQGPLVAKGEMVYSWVEQSPWIVSYQESKTMLREAKEAKANASSPPSLSLREEASLRALAAFLYRDKTTRVSYADALRIVRICHEQSLNHEVAIERLVALIIVESAGDAEAVSRVGARGLMQVMPDTALFIDRARQVPRHERPVNYQQALYDEETNVSYGAWYYNYLVEFFDGNERKALAAYNWGPGAIQDRLANGEGLPQIYWQKVLQVEARIKRDWAHEAELYFWSSGPGGTFYEGDIRDARKPSHRPVSRPVLRRDGEGLPGWEGAAVSEMPRSLRE